MFMWKKSKTPKEVIIQNLQERLEEESVANKILRATIKWYAERKHYVTGISEDKPLRGTELRKETKSNLQKAEEILNQIGDKSNPTHLKKLVEAYYSEK